MPTGVYLRTEEHKKILFQKNAIPWNKGKKLSKEYIEKLRVSKLGIKHSEEHKRKISEAMVNRSASDLTKLKMSLAHKGERNSNWKGGIPPKFYNKIRRKRVKIAGKLTIKTIQFVYEDNIKKYGTLTCYLCLKPILFSKDHLEHKTPLSRGGTNEYCNLAIACRKCNEKKHTRTYEEYMQYVKKTGELLPETKSTFGSFS